MVMFHPRKFAEEMNRPLTYESARAFQIITVTLVWLVIAAWIAYAGSFEFRPKFRGPGALGWVLETVIFAAAVLSMWPMLLMITRAATYWFQPAHMSIERQNRAIALSYYACASLAWLWLPSAMVVMFMVIDSLGARGILEQVSLVLTILAELVVLFILIDWYVVTVYLMKATTHAGGGRTFAMAITLPFLWLLCLVIAAAIPALLAFGSLIVLSFR